MVYTPLSELPSSAQDVAAFKNKIMHGWYNILLIAVVLVQVHRLIL